MKKINWPGFLRRAAMPLLQLLLGGIFLLHPDGALAVIFRILGWLMVAVATVLAIGMITDRTVRPGQCAVAVICGIGGVLLARNPLILAEGTGKLLGALLVVQTLAGMIRGEKNRSGSRSPLLGALPALLLGLFLLVSPMSPSRLIFSIIGILLVVGAVAQLIPLLRQSALEEPRDPNIIDADV